jgi:Cu-Zn family superoxide dismutase
MRNMIAMAAFAAALSAGCGDEGSVSSADKAESASALVLAKAGNTTLAGMATFVGEAGKVQLTLNVTGAPAGVHGVHIHEKGDWSAPDAMSAGAHWNPAMTMHAAPGASAHLGDLGNMTIGADGKGTLTATNPMWETGTGSSKDVVGKAVVVHAMNDDLTSQPAGNAGGRIGCGEIK